MNRIDKILIIFLIPLTIIPAVVYCYNEFVDPYNMIVLASSNDILTTGFLNEIYLGSFSYNPEIHGFFGTQIYLSSISIITDLSLIDVAILPFSLIINIFAIVAIFNNIIKNKTYSFLFSLIYSLDITFSFGIYNSFQYGLSNTILFLLILIIIKYVINNIYYSKLIFSLLLILFIMTLFLIYWTTFLLSIIIVGIIFLFYNLSNRDNNVTFKFGVIFLIGIVLSMQYTNLLSYYFSGVSTNTLNYLSLDFINSIFYRDTLISPYVAKTPICLTYLMSIRYLLLIFPIILYILVYRHIDTFYNNHILIITLLLAAVIQALSYTAFGRISTRFILILFPIILIIIIKNINNTTKIKYTYYLFLTFLIGIILVNSLSFITYVNTDFYNLNSINNSETGAKFIYESGDDSLSYIDFNTFGNFLYNNYNKDINFKFFDEELYGFVIGKNAKGDFDNVNIVINNNNINRIIPVGGWNNFQPIGPNIDNVNNNQKINKIFFDGSTTIYCTS